jgi:hypothetical protein
VESQKRLLQLCVGDALHVGERRLAGLGPLQLLGIIADIGSNYDWV